MTDCADVEVKYGLLLGAVGEGSEAQAVVICLYMYVCMWSRFMHACMHARSGDATWHVRWRC